jgi:hypothetical protein
MAIRTAGQTSFVLRKMPVLFMMAFCALSFSSCVRLSGGAGYWKAGPEGQPTAKTVGFDSADFVPGSSAPGSITT